MTFWDRFRQIWSKRRRKSTLTEIESLRRDIRWSRARLSIKQMPEYTIFREWLEDMILTYYEKLKGDPSKVYQNISSAETVESILSKIESSTPEQIEIDEKNLKTLQNR